MKITHIFALATATILGTSISNVAAEPKQLFHVTAPKASFDATLATFNGELDVWRVQRADGDKVTAQIYATEADVARFQYSQTSRAMLFSNQTLIVRDPVNTEEMLISRAATQAVCAKSTRRHLEELATTDKYVNSTFFDCFRQPSEVFAFFDQLVAENPTIFSKIENVTTTYEGRTVPGYKISTGAGRKPLYTQALIHAREWIAGSATFYIMASFLDGLRSNDPAVTAIFSEYEWHFVPILNLDGYQYSWNASPTSARMWRKNRRPITGTTFGVDLNRNYPPADFWGRKAEGPTGETYPGASVLSEPETSGSFDYVKALQPFGAIDMHSIAGGIYRAYGNQPGTPPAPIGPKLKVLGDAMAAAAGRDYESALSGELYIAYGCFDDAVFQVLGKPTFTIELADWSFIASESTIRPSGENMYRAFVSFAQGLPTYWSGLL